MGFNAEAFMQADLAQRTEDVPVPALKAWFGDDDKPVWTIRALTANELSRANSARERAKNRDTILSEVTANHQTEVREEVRALLGITDDVDPGYARAVEVVMQGSVEPECSEDMAVKLAEHFPVILFDLNNKILLLTGQGSGVEKKPSGLSATKASAPP
jgi:hypothetical protein